MSRCRGGICQFCSAAPATPGDLGQKRATESQRHAAPGYGAPSLPVPQSLNTPPTAVAGPDRPVRLGDFVQLDGNSSFDDNTPSESLSYQWSFSTLPQGSHAALFDADTVTPSFVIDVAAIYVVELVVTEEDGLSSSPDEVIISAANLAPTAMAGPNRLVPVGSLVPLDGSESFDPEHDVLSFEWSMLAAPNESTASLANATTATPSFIADVAGEFLLSLIVSDAIGPSQPDLVTVTAFSGAALAESIIQSAVSYAEELPLSYFTNRGNRTALLNFMQQAVVSVQNGDLEEAIHKLRMAQDRTDGCAVRDAIDGAGVGRDWVVQCSAQAFLFGRLGDALATLLP